MPTQEERTWGMLAHLSGLAAAFVRRRREEAATASDAMAGLDFEPRAARAAPSMSPTRVRDSFVVEDSEDEDSLGGPDQTVPSTSRRPEPITPRPRCRRAPAPT